jgi:hypothetical protein
MIDNRFTGTYFSQNFDIGKKIESIDEFEKLPYNTNVIKIAYTGYPKITNRGFLGNMQFNYIIDSIKEGTFLIRLQMFIV